MINHLNIIENFLSDDECDRLIQLIDEHNERSGVTGLGETISTVDESRTSSTSDFLTDEQQYNKLIHQKIADELDIDILRGETLQGQKYEVGQYFKSHQDWFDGDTYINHCLHSGNRTHTFMVYLNEPEEGGETDFVNLNFKMKPKKGTAVWWKNLDDSGEPINDVQHEGCPVIKGTKYIITAWFRENEWDGAKDEELALEYHSRQKDETPIEVNTSKVTFSNRDELPTLTTHGFQVIKTPEFEWNIIKDLYGILKQTIRGEQVDENDFTGIIGSPTIGKPISELMDLSQTPHLRDFLHNSLLDVHENWAGVRLEPSAVYGIRSYNKTAVLTSHKDREATHHISSIIIVDKDLSCGCKDKNLPEVDWPLDIQDHNGKWHKVYTEPGDMILYESAICEHARLEPFRGRYFRNFYVHYKLADWEYTGNEL